MGTGGLVAILLLFLSYKQLEIEAFHSSLFYRRVTLPSIPSFRCNKNPSYGKTTWTIRAQGAEDPSEEIFRKLDIRRGERVFLVRDSSFWVQDLQPGASKTRWEKRSRSAFDWIADRLDSFPRTAPAWQTKAVQDFEKNGKPSDVRRLGRFGWGFSRQEVEKWIKDPKLPTVPEIILYGFIAIGTIYAIKLVIFLADLLIRFSLSLVLIVGVSFFCVLVLYVFASI